MRLFTIVWAMQAKAGWEYRVSAGLKRSAAGKQGSCARRGERLHRSGQRVQRAESFDLAHLGSIDTLPFSPETDGVSFNCY